MAIFGEETGPAGTEQFSTVPSQSGPEDLLDNLRSEPPRRPRRLPRSLWVAGVCLFALAVAALAVAVDTNVTAHNQARNDKAQIARLTANNKSLSAEVQRLQGASQRSTTLTSLDTQLQQMDDELSSVSGEVTTQGTRMAQICNTQATNSEESNLNGEATGSGSQGNQYYSDLYNIITAICGSQPSG